MASHNVPRPAIIEEKTVEQQHAEQLQIDAYKSLIELIEQKIEERQYTLEVLQLTSKLLKENPEYYTIWNVRRRLLIHGLFSKSSDLSSPSKELPNSSQTSVYTTSGEDSSPSAATSSEASKKIPADPSLPSLGKNGTTLELIQEDLRFVVPLLKEWPKCYWIWNHRIWLLHQATLRLETDVARKLWLAELQLVGMMLVKDNRNFHGWGYRKMVVEQLESLALDGISMVESEFAYTTKMFGMSLANFSALHYRSKLIPRLLDERNASDASRKDFLDEELDMMRNALWTDSSNQSCWFYHQFLMATLTDKSGHTEIVPNFTIGDRIAYLDAQLVELRDMLDGDEKCKWIYNALYEYTLAISRMQERQLSVDEIKDLKAWLTMLRKLDPLRSGRWDAVEKSELFEIAPVL